MWEIRIGLDQGGMERRDGRKERREERKKERKNRESRKIMYNTYLP